MKLRNTLALSALIAGLGAIGVAHAMEGWYGRADVGYSVDGQLKVGPPPPSTEGPAPSSEFDLDDGWMADVGVGHAFRNGFRTEAELAYRTNEVAGTNADAEAWSALANVAYDFNHNGAVSPYLGAGAGYGRLELPGDDDSGWAWQAFAGVGIRASQRLVFDIGYRHFEMPELEFAGAPDTEYEHDAVTVGLRWQFAAAPAPAAPPPAPVAAPPPPPVEAPPPAPAPCPATEFVVYFDWDRANLNQAALATLDSVIASAGQCAYDAVAVIGHTDTSGSNAYNVGLSGRRATVVRDGLIARGVPADRIASEARGETDLAKATRDGVRDPANRRTAVTIRFQ